MADRYTNRPFPNDDGYDRERGSAPSRDSDPLAELAKLIGQTDPFGSAGQVRQPDYHGAGEDSEHDAYDDAPAGQPAWMQHRGAQDSPDPTPAAVHPLRRFQTPAAPADAAHEYRESPPFADADQHLEGDGRYDDALYGQVAADPAHYDQAAAPYDAAQGEDLYNYQDEPPPPVKSRSGGMMTVVAVLALAVVGTGGAYAYRTYVGSPRSGEPPVIKADSGPNKIIPAPSSDGSGKPIQDRLAAGGSSEQLVSREEQPVDVNKGGPRVVFPPLNSNANPPSPASVAPSAPAAAPPPAASGEEPRKIKTYAVRPDQPEAGPAAKPAPIARVPSPSRPAASAQASVQSGNGPLSLSPQASGNPAPSRTAALAPSAPSSGGGGNYVVQVSSQRSEADAQTSYRSLQSKFPSVLGSRPPVIKRADLGTKGVYYRAMVGPFSSPDEAAQMCGNLKSAGGQCVVQRN